VFKKKESVPVVVGDALLGGHMSLVIVCRPSALYCPSPQSSH